MRHGVIAVFIVIVVIWAKKTNQKQAERMKLLSQEQFDFIKDSGYTPYGDKKNLFETVAVLTNIKETTSKSVPIDFIFWNCCTQRYEIGEKNISADLIASKPLKVGDYVRVVFKFKNGIIDSLKDVF